MFGDSHIDQPIEPPPTKRAGREMFGDDLRAPDAPVPGFKRCVAHETQVEKTTFNGSSLPDAKEKAQIAGACFKL